MGAGEASVLALAAEINDCYVLFDDNKARRYADSIRQKYAGTLGLTGVIPAVRPLLEKVQQPDFWASNSVYEFIIQEADE